MLFGLLHVVLSLSFAQGFVFLKAVVTDTPQAESMTYTKPTGKYSH